MSSPCWENVMEIHFSKKQPFSAMHELQCLKFYADTKTMAFELGQVSFPFHPWMKTTN